MNREQEIAQLTDREHYLQEAIKMCRGHRDKGGVKDTKAQLAVVKSRLKYLNKPRESFNVRTTDTNNRSAAEAVSDHAVIRYLERKVGLNVQSLREEIAGTHIVTINKLRNVDIKTEYGELIVRNGIVATIV